MRTVTSTDAGQGLRYVVGCPEDIGHLLGDFFDRHMRALEARVKVAADHHQHDGDLEEQYGAAVHGHQDVTAAFGAATRC